MAVLPVSDETEIELGHKVRDTVTGVEGIAVTKTDHIWNCTRIGVRLTDTQGYGDQEFFDAPQLEKVGDGIRDEVEALDGSPPSQSGSVDDPTRRPEPQ